MKEILANTLNRIAEAQDYHEPAPEYGERAWRVRGRFLDVIYWDMGNGWCDVIKVLPREGHEDVLLDFFDKVEATDDT